MKKKPSIPADQGVVADWQVQLQIAQDSPAYFGCRHNKQEA
jgi:hypothetical protein